MTLEELTEIKELYNLNDKGLAKYLLNEYNLLNIKYDNLNIKYNTLFDKLEEDKVKYYNTGYDKCRSQIIKLIEGGIDWNGEQ